jgi:hypothetical protein
LLELWARLPEKFHGDTGERITKQCNTPRQSSTFEPALQCDCRKHRHKQQPLQTCLVQLAWIPRFGVPTYLIVGSANKLAEMNHVGRLVAVQFTLGRLAALQAPLEGPIMAASASTAPN